MLLLILFFCFCLSNSLKKIIYFFSFFILTTNRLLLCCLVWHYTFFMDFVTRLLNFDDESNVEVEDDFVSNDCNVFIRLFTFLVEKFSLIFVK
jgi:hypothetical protein